MFYNSLYKVKKNQSGILIFINVVIFFLIFILSVKAQTPTLSVEPVVSALPSETLFTLTPTDVDVTSVDKSEYSGEVTKIEGRTLTIDTSDGVKKVTVPESLQIKKNGYDSNFEEIKVNDKVAFAQTGSGELLSISVTSAEVSDFSKRVLPFVIGGVLILGIIYYLFVQRSKGHIKTSTEKVK